MEPRRAAPPIPRRAGHVLAALLLALAAARAGRAQEAGAVAIERLVTGQVVDERGDPVASAWVVLLEAPGRDALRCPTWLPDTEGPPEPLGPGAKAQTGPDGRFSLRAPAGADLLVVHHPSWLPHEEPLSGWRDDGALALDRGLTLRVRPVTDRTTLVAVLEPLDPPGFLTPATRVVTLRSSARQGFDAALTGLVPGRYRLVLGTSVERPFAATEVELTGDEPVHVATVHAAPDLALLMDGAVATFAELYVVPDDQPAPTELHRAMGRLQRRGKDRWLVSRFWPGPLRLLGVRHGARGVAPEVLARLEPVRQESELAVPLVGRSLTVRLDESFTGEHLVRLVGVPGDDPDAVLATAPLRGRAAPQGVPVPERESDAAVFVLLAPGYYRVDAATVGGGRGASLVGQALVWLSPEEDRDVTLTRLPAPDARLTVVAQRPDGAPVPAGRACFRVAAGPSVVAEASLDAQGRAELLLPAGLHGWVEVTAEDGGLARRSARAGGDRQLVLTLAPSARGGRR